MPIGAKMVYEPFREDDGRRILVDRLYPRGLRKEEATVDERLRETVPSGELRKWFSHDPGRGGFCEEVQAGALLKAETSFLEAGRVV